MRRVSHLKVACLLLVIALAATSHAAARSDDAVADDHRLELQAEKVIIFKDGYALVIKRGTATTDEQGRIYTADVPDAAVLGTFWAMPAEGRMLVMNSGWVETSSTEEREVPCVGPTDTLLANVGHHCTVKTTAGEEYHGRIGRVLSRESTTSVPNDWRTMLGIETNQEDQSSAATINHSLTTQQATHFVLETGARDVLLPIAAVGTLSIDDMQSTVDARLTTQRREKRLTMTFAEPNVEREVLVMYFRPGVRWIPTYRVELGQGEGDQKLASMRMQAELLNEAESFDAAAVDIVVGVPNFRFRNLPSPLTLEQTLRNSLQQAAPNLMNSFDNNAMVSNALMSQSATANFQLSQGTGGGDLQLPSELSASANQELFVYSLPELSLEQGHRAAVPIVTADVGYRDVYTWNVHLQRNVLASTQPSSRSDSPLNLTQNRVWRQIDLFNQSEYPWTTGAALLMDGFQPLAQELLTYTSPGATCRVPVTVAVDVRGRYRETEIGREADAITRDDHTYTKITQQAALRLVNRKSESIRLEVEMRFGGRVMEVTDDGETEIAAYRDQDWHHYRGEPAVNNSSTVRWVVDLEPGEVFEPTVDYYFYARQ